MLQLLWVVCVRLRVRVRCGWYICLFICIMSFGLVCVLRSCVLVCTCVLVWLCVTLPHCSQLTTWQRLRSFQGSSRHLDSNRIRWGVCMLGKETGKRLLWAVCPPPLYKMMSIMHGIHSWSECPAGKDNWQTQVSHCIHTGPVLTLSVLACTVCSKVWGCCDV